MVISVIFLLSQQLLALISLAWTVTRSQIHLGEIQSDQFSIIPTYWCTDYILRHCVSNPQPISMTWITFSSINTSSKILKNFYWLKDAINLTLRSDRKQYPRAASRWCCCQTKTSFVFSSTPSFSIKLFFDMFITGYKDVPKDAQANIYIQCM